MIPIVERVDLVLLTKRMGKIKLEDIALSLETYNWKVLSTSYVNLSTEMEFECAEGHKVFSTWSKLRDHLECPICKKNTARQIQNISARPKEKDTYRILALDQSSHLTGWSIYDDQKLIAYGVHEATGAREDERNHEVKEWVLSMVSNWKVDKVGIEGIQYQQSIGVTTFQTLARLQGILIDLCIELKIPYLICPTNTWRAHCDVKGRARSDKKRSMQLLVKKWFDVSVSEDEADAVGIGKYCADLREKKEIKNWE